MDRRNWGALDIASLCKWADAATRRIGRKRLEDALEVYELLLGPFPAGTKEAITRMADLCTAHPEPEQVSMNDIVAVLTQLDSLIREHARSDLAMLALLSDAA